MTGDSKDPQGMGWWEEAFAPLPYKSSPPGEKQMLTVIAYDVSDPRRLTRIARICEDHGMRVQYSVFECYFEPEQFDAFWGKVQNELDLDEDRIVAYCLDAKCAKKIRTAGTMVCSERVVCYLV